MSGDESAALAPDSQEPAPISKQRRSSTWAFAAVLIVAAVLIGHYVAWSSTNRPAPPTPPPRPATPVEAPQAANSAEPAWARENELQDASEPEKQTKDVPGNEPRPEQDPAGSATNLTCADDRRAFDSDGKPCIDLKTNLYRQLIYVTDTPAVQYLYCAIPKNGCTYHLALLNRIYGADNYEAASVIHDRDRKDVFTLYARNSETIARMLTNHSLPKYVVIRNPLRRTLSAYLDKVQPNLPEKDRTVDAFHEWIWEEFPKGAPLDRDWQGVNPHWKPEREFCGYKVRDVQSVFKVFRVEEPEEYVDFLYSIIPDEFLRGGWRGKDNLDFREHVLGPRKRTGNTDEKFERYFNNLEVFDHMAYVLQDDIKVLGYVDEVAQLRQNLKRNLGISS